MNNELELGRPSNQIRCPYCYQLVDRQDYTRHIQVFHPEEAEEAGLTTPQENEDVRTLRRIGQAKPPRRDDVPIGMARCELCNALVPRTRIEEHTEKKHSEQETDPVLEGCSICGADVREDRMEKHMRKVHGRKPDQH